MMLKLISVHGLKLIILHVRNSVKSKIRPKVMKKTSSLRRLKKHLPLQSNLAHRRAHSSGRKLNLKKKRNRQKKYNRNYHRQKRRRVMKMKMNLQLRLKIRKRGSSKILGLSTRWTRSRVTTLNGFKTNAKAYLVSSSMIRCSLKILSSRST